MIDDVPSDDDKPIPVAPAPSDPADQDPPRRAAVAPASPEETDFHAADATALRAPLRHHLAKLASIEVVPSPGVWDKIAQGIARREPTGPAD